MDESIYEKLSSLSEISRMKLAKILTSVPHKKDLTLQPTLIKPLERVCSVSWLKSNGIEHIYKLDVNATKQPNPQFFMFYANTKTFHQVLQLIQSQVDADKQEMNKYHLICVPKVLYAYQDLLEENSLWGIVKLYSFQWLPIHMDEGILSLELPMMFKEIYINEDCTILPAYAKSLWHLYLTLGRPGFILSLGTYSQVVLKQLNALLEEGQPEESDFGGLLLIDRNVDYASALLTPGSYAALLNELYEAQNGVCKMETPSEGSQDIDVKFNKLTLKQPVNFILDSRRDSVYKSIKDKYFTQATDILRGLTKELKVQGITPDMALQEMKRYVATKLQSVAARKQLVTQHLNAAETIVSALHARLERLIEVEAGIMQNRKHSKNYTGCEEYLQSACDASSALALFLLMCVAQKPTDGEVKTFLMKFYHEFGFHLGFLYRNLVKTGMIDAVSASKLKLPPLMNKSNFLANANRLKQIHAEPEKVNLRNPTCCSFVFGGLYVPLAAQIASLLLSGMPVEDLKAKLSGFGTLHITGQYQHIKKSLLVYVVGGITYSEIAALNLLENIMGVKIVKISDRIISKNDIANAFITL